MTSLHSCAILGILLAAPSVTAQGQESEIIDAQEADQARHLHFSAGLDYATDYYFRGIIQETNIAIWQPWAEIGIDLATFEDGSLSVGVHALLLGDNNETLNGGDDSEIYATVGVAVEF